MSPLTQNLAPSEKAKRRQINPTWLIAIALVVIAAVMVFVFAIPFVQTKWSSYQAQDTYNADARDAEKAFQTLGLESSFREGQNMPDFKSVTIKEPKNSSKMFDSHEYLKAKEQDMSLIYIVISGTHFVPSEEHATYTMEEKQYHVMVKKQGEWHLIDSYSNASQPKYIQSK